MQAGKQAGSPQQAGNQRASVADYSSNAPLPAGSLPAAAGRLSSRRGCPQRHRPTALMPGAGAAGGAPPPRGPGGSPAAAAPAQQKEEEGQISGQWEVGAAGWPGWPGCRHNIQLLPPATQATHLLLRVARKQAPPRQVSHMAQQLQAAGRRAGGVSTCFRCPLMHIRALGRGNEAPGGSVRSDRCWVGSTVHLGRQCLWACLSAGLGFLDRSSQLACRLQRARGGSTCG